MRDREAAQRGAEQRDQPAWMPFYWTSSGAVSSAAPPGIRSRRTLPVRGTTLARGFGDSPDVDRAAPPTANGLAGGSIR